jgi:hypothetical protein
VEKLAARITVPEGGSDPENFLGGLKPKKWGRSRPIWCFFHGDSCFHCCPISRTAKTLLAPQAEELGEDEAEVCSLYSLQFFLSGSCSETGGGDEAGNLCRSAHTETPAQTRTRYSGKPGATVALSFFDRN